MIFQFHPRKEIVAEQEEGSEKKIGKGKLSNGLKYITYNIFLKEKA